MSGWRWQGRRDSKGGTVHDGRRFVWLNNGAWGGPSLGFEVYERGTGEPVAAFKTAYEADTYCAWREGRDD